jgi:hypothetical protein
MGMELREFIRLMLDEMEFLYRDDELDALTSSVQEELNQKAQTTFDSLHRYLLEKMERRTKGDDEFNALME